MSRTTTRPMSRAMTADVYTANPVPPVRSSTPHPKQIRHRHGFRQPQNAYDPTRPDIIRVSIQ